MTGIVEAYLTGAVVRHAYFAEFFFVSQTSRIWTGFRNINIAGRAWQPVGPHATVDQVEDPIADQMPSLSLKLSAVSSEQLALALSETDEVRGQLVFIYDQFFDEDWAPMGEFETYAVAKMDTIEVAKARNQDDTWDRILTVSAEYLLTAGASPPAGRYSSADQATRFPGMNDRYFDYMGGNQNKRVRWPTF